MDAVAGGFRTGTYPPPTTGVDRATPRRSAWPLLGSDQFIACRVADAMTTSRRFAAKPVALFVLGFGRSGTSALTRVLSLCGAGLPAGLLGATAKNMRGYWDPRAAIHLNQAILRRHGSSG